MAGAAAERFLVTGALGCIGAWIARMLVREGVPVVTYDLGGDPYRLRELTAPEELDQVTMLTGDVTDLAALERALDEHEITHVIHLAALLIPFARADPPRGALVNVLGTANVFEAVKRRRERVRGLAYASSAAVYDLADAAAAAVDEDADAHPLTFYGVHKRANEGTARVLWAEDRLPSIGLRPYIVYGPGRDQGMTATPTLAVAAAVRGEPYEISWASPSAFNYAADTAAAFIAVCRAAGTVEGAPTFNVPGPVVHMRDFVAALEAAVPEAAGLVTYAEQTLPFPERFATGGLARAVGGSLPETSLEDGVRATAEHFRARAGA